MLSWYMLIASFRMFSTFKQLFPWLTLVSESATSSPVFPLSSCMPSFKPYGLLRAVPFSSLMKISTSFSCLLGNLAFFSAIANVRTPVVVSAEIGSAVRCFVLYSNCSPISSIMKPQPRRHGKQLSAVIKMFRAISPDFGFIWILMSTLPSF